jgi:hypothetical protein
LKDLSEMVQRILHFWAIVQPASGGTPKA